MAIDIYDVYFDRNQAVLAFCKLWQLRGGGVGWKEDYKDCDYVIMFADLPTGQVSWHILRSEINLEDWPRYDGLWDFHVTAEKRDRLYEFMQQISASENLT